MNPSSVAIYLRSIAQGIDNSKKPERRLVARSLRMILASIDDPKYDQFWALMKSIEGQGFASSTKWTDRKQVIDWWKNFTGKIWKMPIEEHQVVVKGIGPMFDNDTDVSNYNFEIEVFVDGKQIYKGGVASIDDHIDALMKAIDG
jgi:hypothetical protein